MGTSPGASRPAIRVHALVEGLNIGGAEGLLSEFAAVAPKVGIEFSVAALRAYGGGAGERLRLAGVEPVVLGVGGLGPRAFQRVRSHLAGVRPDVVHTHLVDVDLLGSVAARTLGIPAVATLHVSVWGGRPREWVLDRLAAVALQTCADRIIAVSQATRAAYLAWTRQPAERVVVIGNGIAGRAVPSAGPAVRAELGLDADDLVVTMISSLRQEKAHEVACAAVALLRPGRPTLKLLIVGDGPRRAEVAAAARPLGDSVVLAGYRADAMAVLAASDVVLHPSYHEAFPTTLIEAAAASVPVVATATGGIGEIVLDGGTGLLVPAPPQPAAIARALDTLLADPARRRAFGEAARARFDASFTAASWARELRSLYDEVLAAPRSGGLL
jgi:glycosyltransferase involved in cell wall biosynthesis